MKKNFTLLLLVFTTSFLFAQTITKQLTWDGLERSYRLFIPDGYTPGTALPLVFNFHGYTSTAAQQEFYSEMNTIADTAGFFVAYPQGIANSWNVGWNFGSTEDDVGFTGAMIDSIYADYGINLDRVYSTGMSNGGFMSYRLACEMNDRIAKIASVTGSMLDTALEDCNPENPIPVMQIHGTEDGVVPYNGAPNLSVAIEELLESWRSFNGCTMESDTTFLEDISTTDFSTAQLIEYRDCDDEVMLSFYKIIGGGHTWPGAPIATGITNYDFEASEQIWHFFNTPENNTTSSEELSLIDQKLTIAPNPFQNNFYVHSSIENLQAIRIFDLLGRTVYLNQNLNSTNLQINNIDWKTGFYFAQIKTENTIRTIKIVKQ